MRYLRLIILVRLSACGIETPLAPRSDGRHLEISLQSLILAMGKDSALQAVAFDQTGRRVAAPGITWQSSVVTIARIGSTGVVRGVAPGRATISATWQNLTATAEVVVIDASGIQVTPATSSHNLIVGTKVSVYANLVDATGRWLPDPIPVSWSSQDSTVATIVDRPSQTGRMATLTAIAPGATTITGTFGGLSASFAVSVREQLPAGGGTLDVVDAHIIEIQAGDPGWDYAPMIRVATGEHGVDITRLSVTFPGSGPAPPLCASIRMLPHETRDLNFEMYGDYQFTISAGNGSRAPLGSTFPVRLEYRNGDGERIELSLQLPIVSGGPPTTYSGVAGRDLWASCPP